MNFSASELVKKSLSQLLYNKVINKIHLKPTDNQIKGNEYSQKISNKEGGLSEKRGIINIGDDKLYFCVDLIQDNKFIEIKMVNNENDFFLKSAILQSTLYCSLLKKVKTLDTPTFLKKEGIKNEIIVRPDKYTFELWFGDKRYKIYSNSNVENFYINKLKSLKNCILHKNFNGAKLYDSKYKGKEFDILNPKYKEITNTSSIQTNINIPSKVSSNTVQNIITLNRVSLNNLKITIL